VRVITTELPGVVMIEPRVFSDTRGFFLETYHQERYYEAGLPRHFLQDNHSRSRRGVLRGLHYQLQHPQGKLAGVSRGRVFDVAVDIRRGSPTFGRWFGCILDDRSLRQLYIPPGFAHGFCVLSDEADFVYKCSDYYDPEAERGLAWNDPDIGIQWPLTEVMVSKKDARNPRLADQAPEQMPVYEGAL
jgi:dTDP-4-dehydrorhamnose 3,5-epimerase